MEGDAEHAEDMERGRQVFLDDLMTSSMRGSRGDSALEVELMAHRLSMDYQMMDHHGLEDVRSIRNAQLLRGAAASHRRVASKLTMQSLQKVRLDELPEKEKSKFRLPATNDNVL